MLKKLVSLLFVIFSICLFKSTANAAIAFVSGSNATPCQSGGATSCTLTLGTINNGNLIIFDGITAAGPLGTLPSGGSSPVVCPSNHGSYFHCYKVWFTGDPTTYAFANASGSGGWLIGAAAWSGEDQTTPIDEYAEAVAGGANGSTIYLPALGGHYDGEMRIADCLSYNGGTMITPTGMTVRESGTSGGQDYAFIYDLTGGPLSNTTPVPTLTCGNPGGSSFHDSGMTWLIKPAGAVADTYNPVAGLACYGWVGHVHDTLDMSNCNLQNGDLVETCTESHLNSGSYGNLSALVPPPKFTASIARDYFYSQLVNNRCTYGYWHTGDPQTFSWGWDGQSSPSTGNVSGDSNYIVHRVPSGTAFIGPANQSTPVFSTATVTSKAITTTQPYSTLLLDLQSSSGATGFSSTPSGSSLVNNCAECYQATFQLDAYTSGSQGAQTAVFNSGTPNSNVYSWIVTATNPFAGIGYVSSSTCSNQVNMNSISCTPPSGTSGDILLAPVFELSDPGQTTLNALKPVGWTLLKYQDDPSQGLVGVTVPDTSSVMLGTLQQMVITKNPISPSGTASYTIHGCAQTPPSWGGGGGLIDDNGATNGTNDTLDRALRMNSSGQWIYSHGATGSLLSGATTLTSPLTYNDSFPHCVAGTFDGTNMNLYVDGSLVAGPTTPSTANVTLPTSGFWNIGYAKQPGFFYGAPFVMGQVAVWNGTALSGAQVASIDTHLTDGTFDTAMAALSPSYWWKLNETKPNQPAVDSGSGGNTGLYYQFRGILNQTSVGGMGDKSPWFGGSFLVGNGGSPQVQLGLITENQTNFSWEAFVQIQPGSFGSIIGLDPSPAGTNLNGQFSVYVDTNGHLALGLLSTDGSGANAVATSAVVNDGALHLIDTTWDGTTLKACIDATCASAGTGGHTGRAAATLYPVIGLGGTYGNMANTPTQNSGSGLFNSGAVSGVIGRVSMWNGVTLTPTQITNHNAHKNDGTYDTVILADNPTSYWKLNETNGAATAIDYGSAGNNGTYTNMQTMAWALWEKTRAASESTVTFPLGNNAIAQGTIIDASNVFNTIDGSNFFNNSGLNNSSYVFGQPITPANDFELNLLGSNGGSFPPSGTAIPPSGTPGIATLQNINFGTYGFTGPTVPDNGMGFDGSTDQIGTATVNSNPMLSNLTQVIAFKTTSTIGGVMLSLYNPGYVPDIWMDNAGHVYCSYYSGQSTGVTLGSSLTYNDGSSHIVACTSPAGTGTLTEYVDGTSVASTSVTGSTGFNGAFRIGGDSEGLSPYNTNVGSPATSSNFFKGIIGQTAIWKGTILTGPQIASLTTHISDGTFDATLSALTPTYWWKMADAASTQPTVVESVAGTNTGIFTGNSVVAYVGASPYQGTFADIGGVMYSSGTWNLGMNLLMPEGVPPPISGGKVLIFIGQ